MNKRLESLVPEFVAVMPDHIDSGILYVSMEYRLTIHRCCCGCEGEVVTPLSRKDWKLYFDGESITLKPSIGNSSFACRSHYFIQDNQIIWLRSLTEHDIDLARWPERFADFSEAKESEAKEKERPPRQTTPLAVGGATPWARIWNAIRTTVTRRH